MVEQIFISFSVVLLVVIFGAAGFAKIKSIDTLEGVIQNFRILPARFARPMALLLPPLEISVAAALVIPATRAYGAVAATALLVVFTIAIAVNLARGRREIDCGCFSSELKQSLNGWLVTRNVILIACAIGLVVPIVNSGIAPTWATWLLGALGVGLTILLYMIAITLASVSATAARRRAATGNI